MKLNLLIETSRESIQSLWHNKMRTFLSMLGIVIGIASVIALLSVGTAAKQSIRNEIESFGVNKINLMATGGGKADPNNFTYEDIELLRQPMFADYIKYVVPKAQTNATFFYEDKSSSVTLYGVDQSQFEANKMDLVSGRLLTIDDFNENTKNIVIGSQVAEDLFGHSQLGLGEKIKYQNQFWQIVGVLKPGTGVISNNSVTYASLSTLDSYLSDVKMDNMKNIEVTATGGEVAKETQDLIKYIFMQRRGLTNPDDLNIRMFSSEQMIESMDSIMGIFTSLLAGIAAISLLVGGIGIMNIMLVTVTERTREIGLRKALGAHSSTIVTQFLVESTLLTIIGGVIGFFLGLLIAFILTKVVKVDFMISWAAVGLAITVSVAIGILFGVYPARKAAKLQPIEALRYD